MAKATIPLAKGYSPDKLAFPVLLSEKIDGVPLKLTVTVAEDGTVSRNAHLETRQGEVNISAVPLVIEWFQENILFFEGFPGTHCVVGEVYQRDNMYAPFKDTSGIVRRQYDQSDKLAMAIFDYCWEGRDDGYAERIRYFCEKSCSTKFVYPVPHYTCVNKGELNTRVNCMQKTRDPRSEGLVARSFNDTFEPNKRSWGYQKIVVDPMHDLQVVGFEEAVSKDGEPLGMVGRVNVLYKGEVTGCGPGKLSHAERIALWEKYGGVCRGSGWSAGIATIKAKRDPSYTGLRQPTFQHWREDKDEPHEE